MIQFIIKLPENETIDNFSDEILDAIKSVNGQFPQGSVINSKPVDNYELKLVMANADTETLEGMIALHDLDWEVLAEGGKECDKNLILPYMNDKDILNGEGELIGSESFDINSLQTYAGKKWLWS